MIVILLIAIAALALWQIPDLVLYRQGSSIRHRIYPVAHQVEQQLANLTHIYNDL